MFQEHYKNVESKEKKVALIHFKFGSVTINLDVRVLKRERSVVETKKERDKKDACFGQ